ncbi:MAG: branched-chain amino acid transaminase [Candidatus Krumholzibacteria bacterium]|jgi:branched-chain amino acid aminotransferase|nr:branched-chain amino acid transaminase [Candidatus Krumholzibacteria bacterium]MDP6669714.1 branched-chain amino acid transaminase [Candidatus Krumholzibacteria bacterium]MDP6798002.1 branched-chain amino acid transaminase [Candidatus Krumholzibacteria bacterium]MDP7021269.1 branched-chain amino acid transaminase [Candidatus Krumholzibacteria bacterium]
MAVKKADTIWMNGQLVDWDDAKIHVLSHVIHYGSSVFEGIRVYQTPQGSAVFRLDDHVRRLLDSSKIYRMEVPFSFEELRDAMLETVIINKLEECYIRPVVYRGYGTVGVDPAGSPIDVAIAVWEWGKYLGPEALEKGVDVCVSSWARMAPNTMPNMAKAASNYMNSQLIKMEAITNGYVEGIGLDVSGYVSEGSGENIFLVQGDVVYTTPISGSILVGITRNTIITLLEEMGYEVREQNIPREMLYLADEVFFTGSASEVTPIRSIDRIEIGTGGRGPVAKKLQDRFFGMFDGSEKDRYEWLTFVKSAAVAK